MADAEPLRDVADRHRLVAAETFDRQQRLVLLRGQPGLLGGVLAEDHEVPEQVAEFRQPLEIGGGQGPGPRLRAHRISPGTAMQHKQFEIYRSAIYTPRTAITGPLPLKGAPRCRAILRPIPISVPRSARRTPPSGRSMTASGISVRTGGCSC